MIGCGRAPTGVQYVQPGITIVSGGSGRDTIGARLAAPLIVRVGNKDGTPARGVTVSAAWDGSPSFDPPATICGLAFERCPRGLDFAATDSLGEAVIAVNFGLKAGTFSGRIIANQATAPVQYTIDLGAPARVRATSRTAYVTIGQSITLTAEVLDRGGSVIANAVPSIALGPGDNLQRSGTSTMVQGVEFGSQTVFSTYNRLRDTIDVRVLPIGTLLGLAQTLSNGISTPPALQTFSLNPTETPTVFSTITQPLHRAYPRFSSPRGQLLYIGSDNEIVTLDIQTRARRSVNSFTRVLAARQLADGTTLVAGYRGTDSIGLKRLSLYRIAVDGTITTIMPLPELVYPPLQVVTPNLNLFASVDIAPDGRTVVYSTPQAGGLSGKRLYVVDVPTASFRILAVSGMSPRLSPDGESIACIVAAGGASFSTGRPTVLRRDGSNVRELSATLFDSGLAWSPDGSYLAGVTISNEVRVLRVVDGVGVGVTYPQRTYSQLDWQ
jgi:hypothetical protein